MPVLPLATLQILHSRFGNRLDRTFCVEKRGKIF